MVGSPVKLRDPENPVNTVNGLDYKYYEGTWTVLPNFNALTPVKTGAVTDFDLSERNINDNFGFKFTGFINVPSDGNYTFYTSSDDGSKLYIGTTEVVNNDGIHGDQESSGSLGLKAGKHALTVIFFDNDRGEALSVSYEGPGITKTLIPSLALYRNQGSILSIATSLNNSNQTMKVYPTPSTDEANLVVESVSATEGKVVVTDMLSRERINQKHSFINGSNLVNLNTSDLEAGMYVVAVELEGTRMVSKIQITR